MRSTRPPGGPHPRFHIQILFAVFMQSRWDYPMPQMRPVLEKMVDRFGADRILWGTDIPIVLLHWTYRQSLDYVRRYCPFLNEDEDGGDPGREHGANLMGAGRRVTRSRSRGWEPFARPRVNLSATSLTGALTATNREAIEY